MPLSEEQKKELKKMNSASFVYGASKMEDEELDSLSAAPASLADLKSKRDVLENKKAFDRAGASATEALQTRRQELERTSIEC